MLFEKIFLGDLTYYSWPFFLCVWRSSHLSLAFTRVCKVLADINNKSMGTVRVLIEGVVKTSVPGPKLLFWYTFDNVVRRLVNDFRSTNEIISSPKESKKQGFCRIPRKYFQTTNEGLLARELCPYPGQPSRESNVLVTLYYGLTRIHNYFGGDFHLLWHPLCIWFDTVVVR